MVGSDNHITIEQSRIYLLQGSAVDNPFFVRVFFEESVDDFSRYGAPFHARADEDRVVLFDIVFDFFVGDDYPVPKLGFGSSAHEVIIFHHRTRKVHHVNEV